MLRELVLGEQVAEDGVELHEAAESLIHVEQLGQLLVSIGLRGQVDEGVAMGLLKDVSR